MRGLIAHAAACVAIGAGPSAAEHRDQPSTTISAVRYWHGGAHALDTELSAVAKLWQEIDPSFAFLSNVGSSEKMGKSLLQNWRNQFLDRVAWQNRVVIDVGAASGLLGEWVLRNGAARYVAIDVAPRALLASRQRLKAAGYREHRQFELAQAPLRLRNLTAGISAETSVLVSTKMIQHLPSVDAIESFLRDVRCAGAEHVVLQVVGPAEGQESSECIGGLDEYSQAVLKRNGHFCRVTHDFVDGVMSGDLTDRDMAEGTTPVDRSLSGPACSRGGYTLEWVQREETGMSPNHWFVYRRADLPSKYSAEPRRMSSEMESVAGLVPEGWVAVAVAGLCALLPRLRKRSDL